MSSSDELVAYVKDLELAEYPAAVKELVDAGALVQTPPAPSDKGSGSIDKGSLISFTAGISPQHQSDAQNSVLLAQLNSDKLFDRFDPNQVIAWYKNYTGVLSKIGWPLQEFQFQNYTASGSTFSIDQAIIAIVSSFLSGPEVAVVEATVNALSNLKSDDPWYKVWDSSTHSANGGNFQMAQCSDGGGTGPLALACSGYAFTTSETTTRFLWVEYHASDTKLQFASQVATLDESVYSQVRDQIIAKLGVMAKAYVDNLDI
jgi:hypothetical protein